MRVSVDLARCQSYGQCVFFAPDVFSIRGREILEYDGDPSEDERAGLVRARAACPVQAITLGPAAGSSASDGASDAASDTLSDVPEVSDAVR